MDIRTAIHARALAHGMGGVIGTPPRLYPVTAPPQPVGATIAYATFQVISPERQHEMGLDSMGLPRVQFDCWGSTRAGALSVRDQVLACFDRWKGSFGGVTVSSSVCENDGMDVEPDDVTLIPRVTLEFQMSYQLA